MSIVEEVETKKLTVTDSLDDLKTYVQSLESGDPETLNRRLRDVEGKLQRLDRALEIEVREILRKKACKILNEMLSAGVTFTTISLDDYHFFVKDGAQGKRIGTDSLRFEEIPF